MASRRAGAPAWPHRSARVFAVPQLHSSVVTALRNVLRREGLAGLYRGVTAMALGAGCVRGTLREGMAWHGMVWHGMRAAAPVSCHLLVLPPPSPTVSHAFCPSTCPTGPATPSTLLPTRPPSSCTAATGRGTTRWPTPRQVRCLPPPAAALTLLLLGMRAASWLLPAHAPLPVRAAARRRDRHHCERRVHEPLGRGEAAHAGADLGSSKGSRHGAPWVAQQEGPGGMLWTAGGCLPPAEPRMWLCLCMPEPTRQPWSAPHCRCGTRRTEGCCTARSRRSGRRGWRPSTSRTGPRCGCEGWEEGASEGAWAAARLLFQLPGCPLPLPLCSP